MGISLFLLMTAYYVVKTVREPLLLADGSAELKSWASAGQALSLLLIVPLYGWVANRVSRRTLIASTLGFFLVCLQLFHGPAVAGTQIADAIRSGSKVAAHVADQAEAIPLQPDSLALAEETSGNDSTHKEAHGVRLADFFRLGFIFYVWVGIFSVATIAQFWGFANDLFSRADGERLFPAIGLGQTIGAFTGAKVTATLFHNHVQVADMLHVCSALVVLHLLLLLYLERSSTRADSAIVQASSATAEVGMGDTRGGFELIFRSEFLRWIAIFIFLLNTCNTVGEYILSRFVKDEAMALLASGAITDVGAYIGGFYGDFFSTVNLLTVALQAFAAPFLLRRFGIAGVVLALPVVALGSYGLIAMGVSLAIVRYCKIAENSTDYSIMNTAKAVLWLPGTRAEKYKAKQAVDTFVVRFGDFAQLGLVLIGTQIFSWNTAQFSAANFAIVVLWLVAGFKLVRMHRAEAARAEGESRA